jgi:hypothetical protein
VALISFAFNPRLADSFIRFGYELYRADNRWIPPFRDEIARQMSPAFSFYLRPGNACRHFLATTGSRVVGRISAMVNKDMKDDRGAAPGLLGFFECVEDVRVARDLIDAARAWLREEHGVTTILGPMNFDIWHGYRFMTRGFDLDPFLGEPYNMPYYPDFFEAAGFVRRGRWHSVEVRGRALIESLIRRGSESREQLRERGYRFEGFDIRRFEPEMLRLHGLITRSFGGFPDFSPMPPAEFVRLFSSSRPALRPGFVLFVDDENGEPAGFAVALLELSDSVLSMRGRTNLFSRLKFIARRRRVRRVNFYAGGLTPEERAKKRGLGRAIFHHILRRILDEGFEDMLVTLISENNKSNGFLGPLAGDYGREYALYESSR